MKILSASGWGVPEIVETHQDELSGTLRLRSCFEREGKASSKPMCDFVRGVKVGGAEVLFGAEFQCAETACAAKGDEHCEFEFRAM